jgi:hypothetical protein
MNILIPFFILSRPYMYLFLYVGETRERRPALGTSKGAGDERKRKRSEEGKRKWRR